MHIRPRHHNLPHLNLRKLHGAQNKFLFARGEQSALARLSDLDLELFRRMRNAVHLWRGNSQRFHNCP